MLFEILISALVAIVIIVTPASTAPADISVNNGEFGCYRSGTSYNNLIVTTDDDLDKAVREACQHFKGDYPGNTKRSWCKEFFDKKIDFSIENWTERNNTVMFDTCLNTFAEEVNACHQGSWQRRGNFYYNNDPNTGKCGETGGI
ncbi:hypothetical protein TWF696_002360 [Orbilia brochopaga]|uniref:Secreted protein n=1 Tax=Orbilia brochopaga TaxID=3140254 RepID=A0AAV9U458_9PEZI